jgi:hypothetical protein
MNITQEFREYNNNRREIAHYHMNIYQFDVSNTIDNRMLEYVVEHDISDEQFITMNTEYKTRISNQCMLTIDWKENYSKIMARAYKGMMKNHGE